MILRKLLTIAGRHGHPGTLLSLGHGEGKFLYLEARTHPVSCIAALEREDVEQLIAACSEWLQLDAARGEILEDSNVVPLVAGAIGRGRLNAATVQNRTVGAADLHVSGVHGQELRRSPVWLLRRPPPDAACPRTHTAAYTLLCGNHTPGCWPCCSTR